jgi:hypothetical protein
MRRGIQRFLLVAGIIITASVLFVACKKSKNNYEMTYNMSGDVNFSWTTDNPGGAILNDTLLVSGKLKDKSACTLIIAGSNPGTYEFSIDKTTTQALLTINTDGSKTPQSNYFSIGGNVTILDNNTDSKVISGVFTAVAVNLAADSVTVDGTFTSKYVK